MFCQTIALGSQSPLLYNPLMYTKYRMKKLWRSLIIIAIIILVAIMINKSIARQIILREANDPADTVLMTITARGGMCQDGPCQYPVREIRGNGSYTSHSSLSADNLTTLQTLINQTDFTRELPSDQRQCASYSDGTDVIWSFPQRYGSRQFVVCEIDIPTETKQKLFDILR